MINHTPAYNLKVVIRETGLNAAVLRAWERRYGIPTPQRTPGGHRLYSQWDIETLKWLMARQAEGLSISRAVEQWKEIISAGRDPLSKAQQDDIYPSLNYLLLPEASVDSFRQSWLDILFAATPSPTHPQIILLGCPPNEWHTFSVLLLNLLLRRRGFQVVYLGANIPLERLEETALVIQPDLIILVAHQLATAATIRSIALTFKDKGFPLGYGGDIFNRLPEVRRVIPGHFLGESIDAAVQVIEQLLLAPAPLEAQPQIISE